VRDIKGKTYQDYRSIPNIQSVVPIYRILYVDDEPDLLDIGKLFLEREGQFNVDTITSAPAALTLMNARNYDAIISDYQMPEMDGIEFLKKVRTSGNAIPFVIFTGRGREEIVINALNEGANFYLQKGGEPRAQFAELTHKVRMAVEHHHGAEKIQLLNRLYAVLTATNKAVFHLGTKEEFFSEICRILIETGGFRMAWIGLADLKHATIGPVASAGHVDGYFDTLTISTDDVPLGRGPTGRAYREGRYYFSNDITRDPNMELWRENALDHGYLATAAFPFALGTKNAGVVSLYAPVTGFFDEKILDLLEELAVDISFSLTTIDERDERKQVEEARRTQEAQLKRAEEIGRSGNWEFRLNENAVSVSEGARILYGLTGTAWTIEEVQKIPLPEYRPLLDTAMRDLIEGKSPYNLEFKIRRPSDGSVLEIHSLAEYDPVRKIVFGVIHDITEQKRFEEELLEKNEELRAFNQQISATEERLRTSLVDMTVQEQALRESEDRFRKIFENSPLGMTLVTPEFRFFSVNPAWIAMTGYSEEELLKMSFKEITHPDHIDGDIEHIRSLAAGKIPVYSTEKRYIRKDGSILWGLVRVTTIYDQQKTLRYFAAQVEDITERKRTEEALRESEEKYRSIFDTVNDGIHIHEIEPDGKPGKFIEVNEVAFRMLQYSREEMLKCGPLDFVTGYHSRPLDVIVKELSTIGHSFFETEHRRKDGTVIPVEINSHVVHLQGKQVIVSVVRDITDRKHAENALRESTEQYRSLIETTGTGYVILDHEGRVMTANEEYVRLTGRSALAQIEGKMVTDWTAPYDLERNYQEVKRCFKEGLIRGLEIDYQKPDGAIQPIEINASVIQSGSGPIILTLCRDITERRRMDQALRQANKKLNLLSGITRHDINNQLTVLQGYLSILEQKDADTMGHEYFRKMTDAAERISSMIQFTKEYESIGVNAPVWQNCRKLEEAASKEAPLGKILIKNDLPPDAEVFADPLIVRVFYNLMDNAVRYGGQITTIRFSLEERDGMHFVVCEDDGDGVSPGEKERIFSRGFGKNTGLGLALSREILDITGITIRETGVPGKGARFEMAIPGRAYRITGNRAE
jgi:PAS domain S-box-containing protein